jgi:hypothetical protein
MENLKFNVKFYNLVTEKLKQKLVYSGFTLHLKVLSMVDLEMPGHRRAIDL